MSLMFCRGVWTAPRSRVVLLAIVAVLLSPVLAAAESQCDQEAIDIEVLPLLVSRNYTTPFAELPGDGAEVGLVRLTAKVQVQGRHVTVGYTDSVLYIASELRKDPCSFQTILEHEERHLAIYRSALADIAARIRAGACESTLFNRAVREVLAVEASQHAFDDSERDRNAHECTGRIYRIFQRRA